MIQWRGSVSVVFVPLAAALVFAGCEVPFQSKPERDAPPIAAERMSLNDIGERALDRAEQLEDEGDLQGALEAYERALWAFSYSETLTKRAALLRQDAEDGVARLRSASGDTAAQTVTPSSVTTSD